MTTQNERIIITIGGGSIEKKETARIDAEIARILRGRVSGRRANALFIPTASHDSLPYFNSFRKTYTSDYNIKVDVALLTKSETSLEKIHSKILLADMLYIGGGDTNFMLETWAKLGVDKMIRAAYERGVILAGLSAGANCWFSEYYSDSFIIEGISNQYVILKGLGYINALVTPHYNIRHAYFDSLLLELKKSAYAIEDNCAIIFKNEMFSDVISGGGKAFKIEIEKNALIRKEL
jgi:dipeptidase E